MRASMPANSGAAACIAASAPRCRRARAARQAVVLDVAEVGLEHLAEAVDQLVVAAAVAAPQRRRPVLLERAPPAGSATRAHDRAPHPRHRLEGALRARQVEREEVAGSCGAALARMVDTLLRATSPSIRMARSANTGSRATSQQPPPASSARRARTARWRGVHQAHVAGQRGGRRRGGGAWPSAVPARSVQARRRRAGAGTAARSSMPAALADIGTSEWPVMPGEVFISSRKGLRSRADHQVGAAPAAAAERAVGGDDDALDLALLGRGRPLGHEVLHVVGEVLVLVVVAGLGRDDADHRQRARCRPSPSTGQVTSSPSMNSSHSTSGSYCAASSTASCICE